MEDTNLYNPGRESNTLYDRAIKYLHDKYGLRFNEIALIYQIKLITGRKWQILNSDSLLIELVQEGIKINHKKLETILNSHHVSKYNPIKGYFNSLLSWDGKDHIGQLCSYVETDDDDDELFRYHLEKWLTRAVLCSLVKGKINKQCFVLSSQKQNVGKTTFWRNMVPNKLQDFYNEDLGTDKDSLIKLSKNFLINMDELAVHDKKGIDALKALISKTHINERLPYGKRQEHLDRIANLVGSTNKVSFLTDTTGNVRWLVFQILSIDFTYSKKVDIDKVWAQAYYNAFKRENYNPELTKEDIIQNEERNEKFMHWSMEKEIVAKYFEPSESQKDFMTATDIMLDLRLMGLGLRLNAVQIGKALKSLKFPVARHMGPKRAHGYLIKRKNSIKP